MNKNEKLQNVTEVKLIYKTKVKASNRLKIENSKTAEQIFCNVWDEDRIEYTEAVKVMYLNRRNKVLCVLPVSEGGISGTVMDIRVILQGALKSNASSMIIAHNHPSGSSKPSGQDEEITKRIKEAGKIIDIQLLDHIIITPQDGYLSFADENLL